MSSGSSTLTALSDRTPPGSPQAPVAARMTCTPTRHASLSDTVPPWTKEEEAALILLRLQNQDNFYKVVFPITPGRVIKHKNLSGVPISPKPSFRDYRESSGNDADEDSTTIVAGLAAGTTIMPQPLIEMKPPTLDHPSAERKKVQVPEMLAGAPPAKRDTVYLLRG